MIQPGNAFALMIRKNNPKGALIALTVIILGFLVIVIRKTYREKKIRENPVFTSAVITGIEPRKNRHGPYIGYAYTIGDKRYTSKRSVTLTVNDVFYLKNILPQKQLALICDSTDPERHVILLNFKDFQQFNYKVPDDLYPVYQLLDSINHYRVSASVISDELNKRLETISYEAVLGQDTAIVLYLFRNYESRDFVNHRIEYEHWNLNRNSLLPLFRNLFQHKANWGERLIGVDRTAKIFFEESKDNMQKDYKEFKSVSSFPATSFLFRMRDEMLHRLLQYMLIDTTVKDAERKFAEEMLSRW